MLDTSTDITHAALDALHIHAFNPRLDTDDEVDEITALAGSIAAMGLEYPLAAFADPEAEGLGVVDGGRRLRALRWLAENPDHDPNGVARAPVPLRVTDDPTQARAWAVIPVTTTKPLHAADEIRAFAAQADVGVPPDLIARAYGVTAQHVQRRLKLAALPRAALNALKSGQISLDTAQALTLATSTERQEQVLDVLITRGDTIHNPASWARRQLAEGAVQATDRRAVFVGLVRYQAEGGTLTEDLFGDHSVLHDEALLNRLFADMLTHKAEQARAAEGWSWVKTTPESHLPYGETDQMRRLFKTPVELTEADAAELERLSDFSKEFTADEKARYTELETRAEGDFTDEDREVGGIFCYVDHQGAFTTARAWAAEDAQPDGDDSDEDSPAPAAPAAPPVTRTATEDLMRIRLLAMQTACLNKSELLLDLLAFHFETSAGPGRKPFAIDTAPPAILPEKSSGLLADARLTEVDLGPDWQADVSRAAFEAFRARGRKHRNVILSAALARLIHASEMWQVIWHLVTPDVRAIWTPDAANLFSAMRTDALDALWADLVQLDEDAPELADFRKLKKGEKAKQLEALFSDASVREALGLSRAQNARIDAWLPEAMHVPEAAE